MNQSRKSIRVAIVGGGIAGLSAAFRIREELRNSESDFEIVLYEQEKTCGGATRTKQADGFSLEHGPNGWLSNEPLTARLIDELDLTNDLISADESASNRYVFTRNKLQPIPTTPFKFLTTGLLRPWEKLRVAREYFTPARKDNHDETIFEFGKRRLGQGFAETMLDPMVSGVFAGDIHQLSLPATFPKMRSMELNYGGLFKAMFAKQREKKHREKKKSNAENPTNGPAGPAGVLTTLQGGTGRFSNTLESSVSEIIQKNRSIENLVKENDKFLLTGEGLKEEFDAVVMAVPAHRACKIIQKMNPEIANTLQEISFANVAVVCHVYDSNKIPIKLNGFGHLIPRRDGIRALGCLWTSCIFPKQVPKGKVLLRTIFGGAHDPKILELSDSDLIDLVIESTATTLGFKSSPEKSWIFRHPMGIAQYTLGHRERVQKIEQFCDEIPGLAFVGASYRGVALNRCVRDAYTVAPRILLPYGINASSLNEKPLA